MAENITKTKIVTLQNPEDHTEGLYPVTTDQAVFTESGENMAEKYQNIKNSVDDVEETLNNFKKQAEMIFSVKYSDGSKGQISLYGKND